MIHRLLLVLTAIAFAQASWAASPSVGIIKDDPFTKLSDADKVYYDQSFSYAMATLQEGQVYDWRTSTSEGQIMPGELFTSGSGAVCRSFSESFVIHKVKGKNAGFGCERQGSIGWCKLREGNMLSCALDEPEGVLEKFTRDVDATEKKGGQYKREAESTFWDWWPF